ncbi:MAG: hypothetical protein GYA14_13845 [Ignavibacteria bacterium]|nr:hypothetical protein [Ignavibacteria bacterium]
MIVNNPTLVLKQINTLFARQLQDNAKNEFERYTEFVKSLNSDESYLFFDAMPAVAEWLDNIDFEGFKSFELSIKNKSWQFGIPIRREIIEDTRENGVLPQIEKFVNEASRNWTDFPTQLIAELLVANGKAFDGTNFFANSRPQIECSNALNNIVAGTGTTIEAIYANLNSAIDRLYSFKAKNNRAYNRGGKILALIPPQLRSKFQTLKVADRIDVGGIGANALKDTFDYLINFEQDITNNDYYVINENAVVKPFIYQIRKEPSFEMVDEKDSPLVKYFSTARANAGYGNPMSIVMVNN